MKLALVAAWIILVLREIGAARAILALAGQTVEIVVLEIDPVAVAVLLAGQIADIVVVVASSAHIRVGHAALATEQIVLHDGVYRIEELAGSIA